MITLPYLTLATTHPGPTPPEESFSKNSKRPKLTPIPNSHTYLPTFRSRRGHFPFSVRLPNLIYFEKAGW